MQSMNQQTRGDLAQSASTLERSVEVARGRKFDRGTDTRGWRSGSLDERTTMSRGSKDSADGDLPSGIAPVDMFIISRLNDSSSYFFTWFCKRYRIRIGVRDLGGKEEIERCPICLDPFTKSIELQCGHTFCRSCLTTSAANNMTSCALCRRKQVINPEVLRARFDEQRMLNLAQRLAIPPPVRARPNISGASMSAGEAGGHKEGGANPAATPSADCGSDQKAANREHAAVVASRPVDVESMTSRGHLLFGPWGDVGAMSPGELRRRWKFSGVQNSAAPVAATVGAASPSELASSWRELRRMARASMYKRDSREFVGIPLEVSYGGHATQAKNSSCSPDPLPLGELKTLLGEVGPGGISVPDSPDSPCAGGAPLSELAARWHALVPTGTTAARCCSSDAASNSGRSSISFAGEGAVDQLRLPGVIGVQRAERNRTATCIEVAMRVEASLPPDDDAGSMPSGALRQRWHEACHRESSDVGAAEARELAVRLALAKCPQGAERSRVASLVDVAKRVEASQPPDDDAGSMSSAALRKRWHEACHRESSDVGAAEVRELAVRLALAKRPQGAERSRAASLVDVAKRVEASQPPDDDAGSMSSAALQKRWHEACHRESSDVGAAEVRELAVRLALAKGPQGAERSRAASVVDVAKRVEASQPPDDDAGSMSSGALRKRWLEAYHRESSDVGAAEVRELAVRLALAKGPQGVGGLSNALLGKRFPVSRTEDVQHEQDDNKRECKSVVGDAMESGELAMDTPEMCVEDPSALDWNDTAKLSILGEQEVGAASVSSLYSRWCAARGACSRAAPVG